MNLIKKTLINISIFALVSFVCMVIFDKFLPYFTGVDHRDSSTYRSIRLREFFPNKTVKLIPTKDYIAHTDSLEVKEYDLRVNSDGYVIGPTDSQLKSEEIDIIFFGGSTTELLYVDEDKRFPYLVSQILEKKSGKRVVSLNGGMSGNNLMHSVLNLLAKGVDKKPKIAVLMHNINDLSQLSRTGSYWKAPHSRAIVQEHYPSLRLFMKLIKDLLVPNLYQVYRSSFGAINISVRGNEWEDTQIIDKTDPKLMEKMFKNGLQTFVKICRIWNVVPVLMTQMNRININDKIFLNAYNEGDDSKRYTVQEFAQIFENFNQYIREISTIENVLLIDLDEELSDKPQYIYDSVHLNGPGSMRAAKIITRELSKHFPEYGDRKIQN